jgi:hypothetical protein
LRSLLASPSLNLEVSCSLCSHHVSSSFVPDVHTESSRNAPAQTKLTVSSPVLVNATGVVALLVLSISRCSIWRTSGFRSTGEKSAEKAAAFRDSPSLLSRGSSVPAQPAVARVEEHAHGETLFAGSIVSLIISSSNQD